MRKINKKILVAALSLLLVACAFVTILSFTMAADGDGGESTSTVSANPDIDIVTIYNIDRIIQNSINGSDKDFHIVEISSSTNYSAMNNGNIATVFAEYVFNGYKTIDDKMKPENIDYKPFSTTELDSDSSIQTCVNAIAKADLIYVHNDSSNYFGKSSNDIPEMIKLQLCSAAVGDFVPFIIDGPIATQEIIVSNSSTYQDLVTKVFKKYGGIKYTYSWDTNPGTSSSPNPNYQGDAKAYFKHQSSLYVQIDGKTQKSKWTKVYGIEDYDVNSNLPPVDPTATGSDAESETDKIDRTKPYVKVAKDPATIGRILVINKTAADGAISTLVKAGITEYNGTCILEKDAKAATTVKDKDDNDVKLIEKVTGDDGQLVTPHNYNSGNVKLYSVPDTSGLYNAYISRNAHPNYMSFEYYASNDDALKTIDYSLYDIIIIEKGVTFVDEGAISNENYDHLVAAMNGNQHILYDKALVGTTSSGNTVVDYGENYDYVCGKVMTSTESGKYDNILVTNATRMNAYMSANNKEAVKDIADIINKASYRGIGGGNGDSSNLYTVLEIQPAYPIDLTLAQKFAKIDGSTHIRGLKDPLEKNPYKSNMTFNQVTGRVQPITQGEYSDIAGNSWYYLRNQGVINNTTSDEISFDGEKSLTSFLEDGDTITSNMLSQVTDYYAWTMSKAKIAHVTGLPYDQINVVHMSTYEFNCTKKTVLDNFDLVYIGGDNSGIKTIGAYENTKLSSIGLSTYNMYFLNGDAYDYSQKYGKSDGSVGTLEGNDISKNKYDELVEYKKKNMPIVIGKDAVNGLTQANAIDPNTYMYSFLKACQVDSAKENILWNFDYDDKVKIQNAGGAYGNTYEGYVTVFGGVETEDYKGKKVTINTSNINEEDLKDTIKNSSQRPKLVVTSAPVQYKEGDSSTWIEDHNVKWTYEAAGGKEFTARLYIDDNANSRFEADEIVDTDEGAKGTLAKKFDKEYFGVVYWKLEVENNSGSKASTIGCLKIKRTTQDKIKVNLLQIMPKDPQKGGDNSPVSLYLCTECQQSRYVLYGNRYNKDKYHIDSQLKLTGGFTDSGDMDGGHKNLDDYPVTTVANNIKHYITMAQTTNSPLYLENMPKYGSSGEFGFNIPNNMGIHEHTFGIVKYDSELAIGKNTMFSKETSSDPNNEGNGTFTGVDNWNTNWFRDVKDDYDVTMNIIYVDEFEKLIANISKAYKNKDTSAIKTLKSKFSNAASEFQNAYNAMVKVINNEIDSLTEKEINALKKYMFNENAFGLGVAPTEEQIAAATAEANTEFEKLSADEKPTTADEIQKWKDAYIETKLNETRYSNFDSVLNEFAQAGVKLDANLRNLKANGSTLNGKAVSAAVVAYEIDYELSFETVDERPYYDLFALAADKNSSDLADHAKLYAKWRDAKIYEQFFRKMYEYYALYASVDDAGAVDLSDLYNCIVFGAAENFAGQDITNQAAIDAIIKYIEGGGQTMLFYDTLTSSSTMNMTNRLGPYFGINAVSTPVDTSDGGQDESVSEETYEGKVTIKLGNPYNTVWPDTGMLEEYVVDTSATQVTVTINLNDNGAYLYDSSKIDITDDATSHEGYYTEHDINVKVVINNTNKDNNNVPGVKIWVNGKDYGTICSGSSYPSNEKSTSFSNTIIKESSEGEEEATTQEDNTPAPLALNPSKLTYATALGQTSDSHKSTTFKYCLYYPSMEAESKTHPRKDMAKFAIDNYVATNAAEQNNEGIVTMYPFSIGANLRVTPTVEGDFTINVHNENMIVYYSLAGGTSGTMSTNYTANPLDGGNNYFVYQYQPKGNNAGTVTYLGAGRTVITGYKRENNDERRFFINLILNTGRKSTRNTTLDLYSYNSTQVVTTDGQIKSTNLIKGDVQDNGSLGYQMTILEGTLPKFSYYVTSDASIDIAEVWAYYDLDFDESKPDDEYHEGDGKHYLVYNKTFNKDGEYKGKGSEDPWVASGYLMWIDEKTSEKSTTMTVKDENGKDIPQSMLAVQDKYLYNNEYTYIVVKVKDTKGEYHYQRLKIIIKPQLHDLT